MPSTEWSLVTADPHEARAARSAIRRFLAVEAASGSDLDAVEIIVGELVANVIQHAPGPIGITVAWDGDEALLVVTDRGKGIPPLRPVPTADDPNGRGLFLVCALAHDVSIETTPAKGTRVVVHLPVTRSRRDTDPPDPR